jgi:hypothetical protein
MFRMEPPPIIRSLDCTYSFWYLSMLGKYQKLYVQSELLMMGGGCTRNMYSFIEINKLRKVTSFWLYLRNIHNTVLSENWDSWECCDNGNGG